MPKKGYQNETVSSATPHLPELVAGAKPLRSHGNLRRGRGHHQPDLLEAPVPTATHSNSSLARNYAAGSGLAPSRSGDGRTTRKRAFPFQRSSTAGSILQSALLWLGSLGRRTRDERGSEQGQAILSGMPDWANPAHQGRHLRDPHRHPRRDRRRPADDRSASLLPARRPWGDREDRRAVSRHGHSPHDRDAA